MPDRWYYIQGKIKSGPVSREELHQLARSGRLFAADMVMKDGDRVWQPLTAVSDLAQAVPLSSLEASQWYFVQFKQKVGPVSYARLKELALTQRLVVNDMVLQVGHGKWQFAGDVPGLFPIPTAQVDRADYEVEIEQDDEERDQGSD